MHKVLVNRLGGLSLPRKSVVRLTDRPDMTLDVYCGCKTTIQQQQVWCSLSLVVSGIGACLSVSISASYNFTVKLNVMFANLCQICDFKDWSE